MKSAYELALERLGGGAPVAKLSDEQRAEIAAIDKKFRAKIAEREVFLQGLLTQAKRGGDPSEIRQLQDQLTREVSRLQGEMEEAKELVRQRGTSTAESGPVES